MRESTDLRAPAGAVVLALALAAVPIFAATPAAAQSSSVTVTNTTVEPESPSAGETFIVEATITNAESAEAAYDLTNVYVTKPGGGRSDVARDLGKLSPGTSTTVRVPVSVAESGWQRLSLQVRGVDEVNGVENFKHPVPVRIGGAGASQISMAATADDLGPSGRTDLRVTVANGLDQAITGVDLAVESDSMTLPEPTRVASRLVPGNQTTFEFPVRDVEPGSYAVSIDMSYTTESGDRRTVQREVSTVVSAVDEPGEIKLRGVEVAPAEGGLEVRGSAANVGTTDVTSVDISVQDGETAGPADSSATYFVGNVPASDFSSFDVHAQPKANGTVTIPLEVSYVVDGVRTNETVEVTHQVSPQPAPGQNPGNGGGGGPGLVVIVGLLFVVGAAVVGWRRYRD